MKRNPSNNNTMSERTGWIGIDYGKKLKGTTAIAFWQNDGVVIRQAGAKQDADKWLLAWLDELRPERIFLDAPLSLPLAYYDPERATDYFYRACDREVKGMSPMFLAALTARAIKLAHTAEEKGIDVLEAYPVGLAHQLTDGDVLTNKEDTKKQALWEKIAPHFPAPLHEAPTDQHQVDALLTWWTGYRYLQNEHRVVGDGEEGLIYI